MNTTLFILTGLQLISSINEYESQFQTIISIYPDFENWYIDNIDMFTSPSDAFNTYQTFVSDMNNGTILQILKLRIEMNKKGWTEEYFRTQPQELKAIAWNTHDASQDNWSIREVEKRIDKHFLNMIPESKRWEYENALRAKKQYECYLNYKPTEQSLCHL